MTGMLRKILQLGAAVLLPPFLVQAIELPQVPLANLKSLRFKERETAQAELLDWSRKQSVEAMDELFRQSRTAEDPEVRERCLAVLRDLVMDEYLKEGEGYVGIAMGDDQRAVPGDPALRSVVVVTLVQDDSPAHRAGLKLNDAIVSLDGQVWRDTVASTNFRELILGTKPGSTVKLGILRGDELLELDVTLARKPAGLNNMFFNPSAAQAETIELAAREAYFQRWLARKKSSN
jgi:predicted metalloprotease with PDZ domain